MLKVQQTRSEGAAAAVAVAGAAAALGVEEMAVTKEGIACASSSLGLHAPGPAPYLTYIAYPEDRCVCGFLCRQTQHASLQAGLACLLQ